MLYCPRCRATYKEGTVRFCTNDNTRLVPSSSKEKQTEEPKGTFTNILGESLLFGEDKFLQSRAESSFPKTKKRKNRRKPLFAPSFEPPKGSRFFKTKDDTADKKTDEESLESGSESSVISKGEISFKDVSLAGVVIDELVEPKDKVVEEEVAEEEVVEEEVVKEEESVEEKVVEEEAEEESVEELLEEIPEEEFIKEEVPEESGEIEEETEEEVAEEALEEVELELEKEEVLEEVEEEIPEEEILEEEVEEKDSADLVGETLKNRYSVIEKLGEDDVGAAYLAQDKIALNKKVVITVFADLEVGDEDQEEGNFGEIRELLAQIKHPNIEAVLDVGKLPSGNSYIISEFLEGKPLSDEIEIGKQFDIKRTARIIRQISLGLNELHQKGFIYRNLRPESIVLCVSDAGTEQVKILNPAVLGGEVGSKKLDFKSPEQLEGNVITIASDTYSLGSIAYLMLTGQLPFAGEDAEELFEAQKKYFKLAPSELRADLPSHIDKTLKKTLAFNPADRYIQTRHFGDAFYDDLVPASEEEKTAVNVSEEQQSEPVAFVPGVIPDVQDEIEVAESVEDNEEIIELEDRATEQPEEFFTVSEIQGVEEDEVFERAEDVDETVEPEESESVFELTDLEVEEVEDENIQAGESIGEEEPLEETEVSDSGDIFESTPFPVAAFSSGEEDIIDLDVGEDAVSAETLEIDDQIIEIDDEQLGIISGEDELIELDTGETDVFPAVSQTPSPIIELDLDNLAEPEATQQEEFELDFDEIEENEPVSVPVDSTASGMILDIDDAVEPTRTTGETLPGIELNLEGLDKPQESPVAEETFPEFEFDLDEIDAGTEPEVPVEIVEEEEIRKPEIRIISPEKPYYKSKKIEEVAENIAENVEEEELKPVVVSEAETKTTEESEIGKKVEGDVEEKDYSWVLLPLLLLLLLIAAIAAFWYFGGGQGGQNGLIQNTNVPANNNSVIPPDQSSLNADQTNINGVENENIDNSDQAEDTNSETDYFGDNFGAPAGPSGRRSVEGSSGSVSNPKPPPPPRTIIKTPDKVRYRNTKKNIPRKLQPDFLGFTIDYPKDWKKNSAGNNFLDISKDAGDGSLLKQFLITKYDSTGTYEGDQRLFEQLVEKSNNDLRKILPGYEMISKGETTIQDGRWRAYEVEFKGINARDRRKPTYWGRRFWIPIQRPGMDSGFVITMLASSLSNDVNGIEDVGVDDELAEILKSFEPTLDN